MEFPFYVSKALPLDSDGFAILDAASPSTRSISQSSVSYGRTIPVGNQDSSKTHLVQILDKMGEASSRAQGLGQIITSYTKFQCSGDQRLYIKVEENLVCGILKIGKKNLFYTDGFGGFKEIRPLCVLDFYVHESMQRKGIGKLLFERMLLKEGVGPQNLAYDRPSIKFISFLKKHYDLSSYIPQNNNFVIFNEYWNNTKKTAAEQTSNKKGYESGSIQDFRDKRFNTTKTTMQPDSQKVEKNVMENSRASVRPNSTFEEYKNQQPPSRYSFNGTENRANSSQNASRTNRRDPTFTDVEAQMKAADEAFAKEKIKTDSVGVKGKTQIWNVSYDKPQVNYSSNAPWGSYGANTDSFKSSASAYGSHYTYGRSMPRNK